MKTVPLILILSQVLFQNIIKLHQETTTVDHLGANPLFEDKIQGHWFVSANVLSFT